jgi:hypothetical protein
MASRVQGPAGAFGCPGSQPSAAADAALTLPPATQGSARPLPSTPRRAPAIRAASRGPSSGSNSTTPTSREAALASQAQPALLPSPAPAAYARLPVRQLLHLACVPRTAEGPDEEALARPPEALGGSCVPGWSCRDIKEQRDADLLVLPTDAVLFEDEGFRCACPDKQRRSTAKGSILISAAPHASACLSHARAGAAAGLPEGSLPVCCRRPLDPSHAQCNHPHAGRWPRNTQWTRTHSSRFVACQMIAD